jgi:hypothetical protein
VVLVEVTDGIQRKFGDEDGGDQEQVKDDVVERRGSGGSYGHAAPPLANWGRLLTHVWLAVIAATPRSLDGEVAQSVVYF